MTFKIGHIFNTQEWSTKQAIWEQKWIKHPSCGTSKSFSNNEGVHHVLDAEHVIIPNRDPLPPCCLHTKTTEPQSPSETIPRRKQQQQAYLSQSVCFVFVCRPSARRLFTVQLKLLFLDRETNGIASAAYVEPFRSKVVRGDKQTSAIHFIAHAIRSQKIIYIPHDLLPKLFLYPPQALSLSPPPSSSSPLEAQTAKSTVCGGGDGNRNFLPF